jgi:hypothetical protein
MGVAARALGALCLPPDRPGRADCRGVCFSTRTRTGEASWDERRGKMTELTEAMVHLRGEIDSWRRARVALRSELIQRTDDRRAEVSAMCARYGNDRAGARRAWSGLSSSGYRGAAPLTMREPCKPVVQSVPSAMAHQVTAAAAVNKKSEPRISLPPVSRRPAAVPAPVQKPPAKRHKAR